MLNTLLDPAGVLPDFEAREQRALLARAIFDEATYGRVRFHHRAVREISALRGYGGSLIKVVGRKLRICFSTGSMAVNSWRLRLYQLQLGSHLSIQTSGGSSFGSSRLR